MNDLTQPGVTQDTLTQLHELLASKSLDRARGLLSEMHPSEIADFLESLPGKSREKIWNLIEFDMEGDVLSHLHDAVRTDLLERMQPQEVAAATKDLETDDVADIIQDLPVEIQDSVLLSMDEQNRVRLASVLSYPEDTAGGLMNTDVISVRADVSLDVVTRYLRRMENIPERTDNLMVVDRNNLYLGALRVIDILVGDPEQSVGDLMKKESCISADFSASEVAKVFEQRDLVSAAVVNDKGILLGRITVDENKLSGAWQVWVMTICLRRYSPAQNVELSGSVLIWQQPFLLPGSLVVLKTPSNNWLRLPCSCQLLLAWVVLLAAKP